jgi:hypothetical protein
VIEEKQVAGVVGRPDPPLRAVEELLRRWAQLSQDLDPERDELPTSLEIMVVLVVVWQDPIKYRRRRLLI